MRKFVPVACLTNLYSLARGYISQSTALTPGGPYILPLVNMIDLINASQGRAKQNEEPVKAPGKRTKKASSL